MPAPDLPATSSPPAAAPDTGLTPRQWGFVALAAVAAVACRLAFATQRGFWLDEYYTLHAARLPWDAMVLDRLAAGHSPLPFLYAALFRTLFGEGELALRASSALASGLALVGCAGLLGRLRLQAALIPLLGLGVLHPYWQNIGTEFRYTMPLVAAASFWSWAAVAHALAPRRRTAFAVLGFGAVCLLTHGSAQLILLTLGAFTIWVARERGGWWTRLSPLLGALLVAAPLFLALALVKKGDSGAVTPSVRLALANQMKTFFGEEKVFQSVTGLGDDLFSFIYLGIYGGAIVLAVAVLRRDPREGTGRFLAATLVGVPVAALVISGLGRDVQGPERYVAFTSVPLLVLMAMAWVEASRHGIAGKAWRGAVGLLIPAGFVLQCLNQGDWHREAIRWMAAARQPQEPVFCVGRGMNLLAFGYHGLRKEGFVDGVGSNALEEAVFLKAFRTALEGADSGFLFLYHSGRLQAEKLLAAEAAAGRLRSWRVFRPSGSVTVYVFACTPAGEARVAALPPMPRPRVTDNPPRRRAARD